MTISSEWLVRAERARFRMGDRVRKKTGSQWHGTVVGYYTTKLTAIGICVESEREEGSVQIYPEHALELVPQEQENG